MSNLADGGRYKIGPFVPGLEPGETFLGDLRVCRIQFGVDVRSSVLVCKPEHEVTSG